MKPIDVYPLYDIIPVKGEGSWVWDDRGQKYLDMYGGHAVISIGHSHPHYITRISKQLQQIGFYSNSVVMPIQQELATKLGEVSGYEDYSLFLCNSGAEAIENAIKLAAFNHPGDKIIAFDKAFHGRTSMAIQCTDTMKNRTQFDHNNRVVRLPFNDIEAFEKEWDDFVCAVIIEGIQGIGGIHVPTAEFMQLIRSKCDVTGAKMIVDEVQSGFGRSGKFFAHQYCGVQPDIIPIAKGMGNGFPVGGVLASPKLTSFQGMLGSTFGGNFLACAASLAVLEIMEEEQLMENAVVQGDKIMEAVAGLPGVRAVRGAGLMIGIEMDFPVADLRKKLLFENHIFTGSSSDPNVLRLLPSLAFKAGETELFLQEFAGILEAVG